MSGVRVWWAALAAMAWAALASAPVLAQPGAAVPQAVAAAPLVDLAKSAPRVDASNFRLVLTLHGLGPEAVKAEVSRVGGAWMPSKESGADAAGLTVTGKRVSGALRLTAAIGGKDRAVVAALDAAVRPATEQPRFEEDLRVRRFWTVKPRSQGAVWTLDGRWTATVDGQPLAGKVAGFFAPRVRRGAWNMGRWAGGLALDFDMGTRRVNWNHVRLSVLELPEVRDLTAYGGLRLAAATDTPRDDVEVSVWLRESDGSWYYVKSALPLADARNEAVVLFEDFAEAEWVSPTNHMDEDYVLDLRTISHVAVGVVNPLGVGPVRFRLTGLDLVKVKRDAPGPARCEVTGRTLSVNGHEMIPSGIFGGYATYLPQAYRPGCQRDLYAPTYPHMPRQVFVEFKGAADFTDWTVVYRALKGEEAKRAALGRRLMGLLDARARRDLGRLRLDRLTDPKQVPGQILKALNGLLRRAALYDAAAWKGVALGPAVRKRLAGLGRGDFTDTDLMELNRRLLEAAFPDAIRPVGPHRPTERFWIDCYGERKQPADLLTNPHWKEDLYDYGRRIATNARKNHYVPHIEFWNEPYLNWAERSRVNLSNRFYREDLAKEGGPVAIKRSSRLSGHDVRDWPKLVAALKGADDGGKPTPAGRIRALLGRRTRERLAAQDPSGAISDDLRRDVLGALNGLLRRRDLYDARAFRGAPLSGAVRGLLPLVGEPNPPRDRLERLNRGLLAAALGDLLAADPAGRPPEIVPHFKWVSDGRGGLQVIDETAFTYWSGRGNGWIYDRMYGPFARGIKETCPEAQVIAGWGFRWNEDHWAAWDMLYRPTIDRNIRWIDGIDEHHYQGDTTAMNGSYEVLSAYTVTRYNKWLPVYNTEANDLIDAPARGRVDTPAKAAAATEYRRLVYNLRDLVYCILQSPDKFIARTMIHPQKAPEATRVCFGLLKNLRGRLVETRSGDAGVWCVAGIDGTDTGAMPPGFDGAPELVAVVFNDHRRPRDVEVTVRAPAGTHFAGGCAERTVCDEKTFRIDLEREAVGAKGTRRTFAFRLPERSAWKVALRLEGTLRKGAEVRRKQFFAPDILAAVRRGKVFETRIAVDAASAATARRAWLRAVVEDLAPGEGTVTVGAAALGLPKARTADNVNRIIELPLDPKTLGAETPVAFRVSEGNHAGYRVDMVSIVLEQAAD